MAKATVLGGSSRCILKKPAAATGRARGKEDNKRNHRKKDRHKIKKGDRHKCHSRARPSGRYTRGARAGSWKETEIGFNMVVAQKDAVIKQLEGELASCQRERCSCIMQLAASRAVCRGWHDKWRRVAGPGAPSNSESDSSSWKPEPESDSSS